MFKVKVEGSFSSAHNLREYRGKCEDLHGHNWRVEIVASRDEVDKTGMVADFKDLRRELNKILERFDHKYLNKIPYFKKANPTSENIAKYIYDNLKARIPGLTSVTVWENERSSAIYEE